jgi:flagellar hook protein FlgE
MAFDSLFIGVTGLDAYQQQIDVISNNIANVGTTGFKGQNVNFQDLLYQTQQFASAPSQTRGGINSQDVGLGVKVGSIDTDLSQGGLQTTGINTNLAINGDGFFVLGNTNGSGQPQYTRNGDFSINQNGILYDPSSGLAVQGFTANSAGVVNGTGTPGVLQIPIGLKSQAVGTGQGVKSGPTGDANFDVSFGGNLDQTQYITAASGGAVALTTISTTIYDSLGGAHLVNVTFQPEASSGGVGPGAGLPLAVDNASGAPVTAATEWSYTITSTDGTTFNNAAGVPSKTSDPQFVYFDQNGQFINTASTAQPGAVPVTGGHTAGTAPSAAQGNQLTIAQWSNPAGANNSVSTPSAAPPPAGPIGLDFSDMSSLAGSPLPTVVSQNGFAQGVLSNITVGQDGTITGAFTNGQAQTLGRVALATFQNEQGLTRAGGSAFLQSANSGLAQIGAGASGRFGQIISGSLEQSNVSIASEFTKMIVAQNAFAANSKSITTGDQDMQTVIGLIR